MTRRERLERKLELRREWAEKREAKASASFNRAHSIVEHIPFGQPILVGHHSERHHRADLKRHDNAMRAGCESAAMAEHHTSKAGGIESALERSVFSDDENAIEALEARIAEREAERDEYKKLNAYFRKHKTMKGFPGLTDEKAAIFDAGIANAYSWDKKPVPGYKLTNLGACIRTDKKRIEEIKRRNANTKAAEDAGGVNIRFTEGEYKYAIVTFAEKPDRAVLNALKASGFHWGGGSWVGAADAVPEVVRDLVDKEKVEA